jgi:two-component system, OmpR family, response regulator
MRILVDTDPLNCGDVLTLIKLLRHANCNTSLFIFAGHLDLQQRLCLFEAGVDDYVCEPVFGSEIAVRLGLSMRLRQKASGLSAPNSVNVLRSGDLGLDLVQRIAARSGKAIDLRPREFLLLEYLVHNVNINGLRH